MPKTVNHVDTVDFATNQDPRRIAMWTPNAKRASARFSALRIHIKDRVKRSNNMMTLNFAGGSVVVTGAFTLHAALLVAQQRRAYVEEIPQPVVILDEANYPQRIELRQIDTLTEFLNFRPVNIVGNGHVAAHAVSLADVHLAYRDDSKYQPRLFPALKFELKPAKWPGVTALTAAHIFDTGKDVIMGGKSMRQMHIAQQCLEHLVDAFGDATAPVTPKGRYEHRIRALRDASRAIRCSSSVRRFLPELDEVAPSARYPQPRCGDDDCDESAPDRDPDRGLDDFLTGVVDDVMATMWASGGS